MMTKLWWAQIKAVIRLEMRKTFFARRGLWIYVVAALPVLLFTAYSAVQSSQTHRREAMANRGGKRVTAEDLQSVREGMTRDELIAALGKPAIDFQWTEERAREDRTAEGANEDANEDANEGASEDANDGAPKEPQPPEPPPKKDARKTKAAATIQHENYRYSDGKSDLFVDLTDGKVTNVNLQDGVNAGQDSIMFAGVFQFFFLRLAVFFGCLGIFMNLFRGEILDRSLHFYFLAPVRREVLMVGKFLAGLLATSVIFVTSEVLQTIAFLWHFPPAMRDVYLYHNHGLENAAIYAGVTVLACVGYGAFFLIAGMMFKNPILPAATILLWEAINPFLPGLLKKFSVIYYLKALCPVNVPSDTGTPPLLRLLISNGDPVSAPLAVLGILAVSAIALYASSLQVRRMEINYSTE